MNKVTYTALLSAVLIFCIIGVLSFFFVPTHDDLIRTTDYGLPEAFSQAFNVGNGRYLGNTFAFAILNNDIVDPLLRALFLGGVVVLTTVLVSGLSAERMVVAFVLYIGLGLPMFRQCYVWGHGFYNYVPPVFFLMLTLCLMKYCYKTELSSAKKWVIAIAVLITSFSAQFFSENNTTMVFLVTVSVLVWVVIQNKTTIVAVLPVVGAGIGAVLMFFMPKWLGLSAQMEDYRSTATGVVEYAVRAAKNAFEITTVLSACWSLWLVVTIGILLLARSRQKQLHWIYKIVLVLFPLIAGYQSFTVSSLVKLVIDGCFGVYLLCGAIAVLKILKKSELKRTAVIWSAAILSALQLLIVSPIGPRCLFITYALLVLWVLDGATIIKNENTLRLKWLEKGIAAIATASVVVLLAVYVQAWNIHAERMEYAYAQLAEGKTQIEIIELPFESFFHCPNESYVYQYTFNHGDKAEMHFEYISYDEYCNKSIEN